MLFTYIGDEPQITKVYGVVFVSGKPTEVTDPNAIEKLNGNPTFSVFADDDSSVEEIEEPKKKGGRPKK